MYIYVYMYIYNIYIYIKNKTGSPQRSSLCIATVFSLSTTSHEIHLDPQFSFWWNHTRSLGTKNIRIFRKPEFRNSEFGIPNSGN